VTFTRRTIRTIAEFEGKALHGGHPVKVRVHPSSGGIFFRAGSQRREARPVHVTDTSRCTTLGEISTIEHVMSALAGLEITDAEVEVEGGELPGLDGSALPYVEGLLAAGIEVLGEAPLHVPFKRVFFQEKEVKVAIGKGTGHWQYTYDVSPRWPGEQTFEVLDVVSSYAEQVAPARTLVLAEEMPMVRQYGLGKGLDEASVVVLGASAYETPVRFSDEPSRHKLLDLIGDLYLAGIPIRYLNVSAQRSGHRTNIEAARLLLEFVEE